MSSSISTTVKTAVASVVFALAVGVVFFPEVFYSRPHDLGPEKQLVVGASGQLNPLNLNAEIEGVREEVRKAKTKADSFKNWVGSVADVAAYDEALYQQRTYEKQLNNLMQISPLAFSEARELFAQRQKVHAGIQKQMFWWDMIIETLFMGGGRSDSLAEAVISAVLRLIWRLTAGAVFACIDFLVRLPWYIREFDVYTPVDPGTAAPAEVATPPTEGGAGTSGSHRDAYLGKDLVHTGWGSTIKATIFYALVGSGAILGTVLTILMIWSPVIALIIVVIAPEWYKRWKAGRSGGGAAGGARQSFSGRARSLDGEREHVD